MLKKTKPKPAYKRGVTSIWYAARDGENGNKVAWGVEVFPIKEGQWVLFEENQKIAIEKLENFLAAGKALLEEIKGNAMKKDFLIQKAD